MAAFKRLFGAAKTVLSVIGVILLAPILGVAGLIRFIAVDVVGYIREVFRNANVLRDGVIGDGGSSICGGMGPVLGYLPVATYFRDPYVDE